MSRLLLSLVACACALVGFCGTLVVDEDKTATGDWTADVAEGDVVEVTAAQSGTGKIVKKGAGTLTLKAGSTFSGGVEIQAGRVRAEADTALGGGTVTIAGGNVQICELDVIGAGAGETFSRTIGNAIHVVGTTSMTYPAIRMFGQNNVVNSEITAEVDLAICEDHASVKAISTSDWDRYTKVTSTTFNGAITATGKVAHDGWCKNYFNGKINADLLDLDGRVAEGSNHNAQYFFSVANDVGHVYFDRKWVYMLVEDCFKGALVERSGSSTDRGAVALGGKKQSFSALMSPVPGTTITDDTSWTINREGGYGKATLTLTGIAPEAGESAREVACTLILVNKLDFILDAYTGFTQVFRDRPHTMVGTITVKKGALKFTGSSTLTGVTKLTVEDTFEAETTQPFTNGQIDLAMGKDAVLKLPEGSSLEVKTLTLDGKAKAPGRYTAKRIAGITSGTVVVLTGPAEELEQATWTAGGTDTQLTTAANWNALVDAEAGNVCPTFASAGTTAAVDVDAFFAGLKFMSPVGSAGFSLVPAEVGVGSILLTSPEIAVVDTDDEKVATYAINVPVNRSATDSVLLSVPTNKTLSFGAGLNVPAGGIVIAPTKAGTVVFGGESTVANQLLFGTGTTIRVTGTIATPNHASQGTARENQAKCIFYAPAGNKNTPITLENGRIEKPIYLQNDGATYPIVAVANTVNTIAGDVRFAGNGWSGFKAEENAILYLEGGAKRSGTGMFLSGPGTIHVRRTGIMAAHSTNGALVTGGATFILEATGNDFTYLAAHKNGETIECRVSDAFSGNRKIVLLNGFNDNRSPQTSGSALIEFNATTQQVAQVFGSKIGTFRGEAGSLLVATGDQNGETLIKASANRVIASQIEGALSLKMAGTGTMLLKAQDFATTGDLVVTNGTLELAADATWTNGANVVVSGVGTLKLNAKENLSKTVTKLQVTDDGKVDVAAGVRVKVAELWLNGVRQANGTYQKGDETPWLTGDGRLTVGSLGLVLFVR